VPHLPKVQNPPKRAVDERRRWRSEPGRDANSEELMLTLRLTVYRYGLLAALVLSAGAGRKWG
jgi:hypothetical protein